MKHVNPRWEFILPTSVISFSEESSYVLQSLRTVRLSGLKHRASKQRKQEADCAGAD